MASSSKKRKRSADDSFRQNFRELRDTGVPDTGPKRPTRNKKAVSLTPAAAATLTTVTGTVRGDRRSSGVMRGKRRRRSSGGGGGGRGGRRRSLGEPTPRTRLRRDIRDLINSAVERGDVMPPPTRTTLTPHVQSTLHRRSEEEEEEEEENGTESHGHTEQSMVETVDKDDTNVEIGRDGRETDILMESHEPITPADTVHNVIVDDTPTQDPRIPPQSVLKGIHSFSSLRKKSLLSRTPHSVTFTDDITINEYSPDKNSDINLDSSSASSASSSSSIGDDEGAEQLEPPEGEDENEGEQDEEEEEEEEEEDEENENGVRMKTPHLIKKQPSPSSRKKPKKSSITKPRKATSRKARKPRKSSTAEKAVHRGVPKTLSKTLLKNLFMLSARRRITRDVAALIVKFSEVYLKRCSEDIAQHASHAGRRTVEVDDVILLMRRQRFITDSEPFEYLVHSHLPMEYVEELLPCAVAGKKIIPTRIK